VTPASDSERHLHGRLLARDAVAPADLAEGYLAAVADRLRKRYPRVDKALIDTAAIDAVLGYAEHPERFDPSRSDLRHYLTMSAEGDLLNALAAIGRRARRRVPLDVAEAEVARNPPREEQANGVGGAQLHDHEELIRKALEVATEPGDREILQLMLNGERRTGVYSEILGLKGASIEEQRRTVKKHKDRLGRRLRRLGIKLDG
jgi:RNA polymerase sigma-70 factor, ECF subfamily